MKAEWIELKKYYTYKTCYLKTNVHCSFNSEETQNVEYRDVEEKIKRYKEVVKEGELSIFYILKYWRYYRPSVCIIKAIEDKYKCCVYKLNYVKQLT